MGREVRRVPANWEHPKNSHGHFVPLHDRFPYNSAEIEEGLRDGWLSNDPPNYGCDVMPQWPAEQCTHLQMYETCSEGTPISPVMATPEELARWLANNVASAFGSMTATYEEWLATIGSGGSVGALFTPATGEWISGVAAELKLKDAAESGP